MLLIIFFYVFTLLGCSIYGGNLEIDSRRNWDSLYNSFMITFQVMIMYLFINNYIFIRDNWFQIMYIAF